MPPGTPLVRAQNTPTRMRAIWNIERLLSPTNVRETDIPGTTVYIQQHTLAHKSKDTP